MSIKIGTTDIKNINVNLNGTSTSLTQVNVIKNGTTTTVWGKYTLTFNSTNGTWKNSSGTVISSVIVMLGTSISKSGNTVTIGDAVYTFTPTTPTARYTYTFSSITWTPSTNTITANTVISGIATRTLNTFYVYVYAGTGISNVYLSTSSIATSGSVSGTQFNYGTTVYAFAVLKSGYKAQSSWTLISGTANTAGAKYRVGTKTNLTVNYRFGTINATVNTPTWTVSSGSYYYGTNYYSTTKTVIATNSEFASYAGKTITMTGTVTITTEGGSSYSFGNTTLSPYTSSILWMIGIVYADPYEDEDDYGSAYIQVYIDSSGQLIREVCNDNYNLQTNTIPVSVSWTNLTFKINA